MPNHSQVIDGISRKSVKSDIRALNKLHGPNFSSVILEKTRRLAGTTFATALSDSLGIDVSREGINAVMHRPIGFKIPELGINFILSDPRSTDLSPLHRAHKRRYASHDGSLEVIHHRNNKVFAIVGHSADRDAVRHGHDRLEILLSYDIPYQLSTIGVKTTPCRRSLSRSYFSLLFQSSGFAERFPHIKDMLTEQLVLETPSDIIRKREKIAYGEINLDILDQAIRRRDSKQALHLITELQHSKALELRRFGAALLHTLFTQKTISEEEYFDLREKLFLEDVREDLIFIERTLRSQPDFTQNALRNLFNDNFTQEDLIDTQFSIHYYARGCNKQIYVVHATLPNGLARTFAIATIRDGQFSQTDFDQERINNAYSHWREISQRGCPHIVKFGAEKWHYEWRSRRIKMHNGHCPVLRMLDNDILLVAREFFDESTPVNVLYHQAETASQRKAICFEMAKAYWQFWLSTCTVQKVGTFFTTPRGEDIVRSKDGRFMIVDPDTIVESCNERQAYQYFLAYPYYNRTMLKKAKQEAELIH